MFEEQIGRAVTVAELLEVLEWALPGVQGPVSVSATLAGHRKAVSPSSGGSSAVPDVGDAVFALATEAVSALVPADASADVDPRRLGADLTDALRRSQLVLGDVDIHDVRTVRCTVPLRKARMQPGQAVAIPVAGGARLAVVLDRNRFGVALAVLDGVMRRPHVTEAALGGPVRVIHTDDQRLAQGAWWVLGRDAAWVERLGVEPEIYHSPRSCNGEAQGEFGLAETPDGRLRRVGREEAEGIGLLDDTYRQVLLSEEVEKRLAEGVW
ncbi:MAG TPA: hypothetical protein VF314_07100 [Actinomycetes bacterium]